jgi:hypothetical protein
MRDRLVTINALLQTISSKRRGIKDWRAMEAG